MITAHLKGGLGNQMFQYARARAAAKKEIIALNVYELEHMPKGDTPRSFALDVFALGPTEIVSRAPSLLEKVRDKCLRIFFPDWGYFQSEIFFSRDADLIRDEFKLKNPSVAYEKWAARIDNAEVPVSIHIRRGDYAKNPRVFKEFGVCSSAYYEKALRVIENAEPNQTYIVFSDDLPWVREHLPFLNAAIYVEDNALAAAEEVMLMSHCSHHIIANSSFSWWGAWLNPSPEKVVIAPTPWFDTVRYNSDIIPDSWTQLPKN